MSCKECEEAQNRDAIAYYRWKTANLALKGCDKHLREVFDALNLSQSSESDFVLADLISDLIDGLKTALAMLRSSGMDDQQEIVYETFKALIARAKQ